MFELDGLFKAALIEDVGAGDVTTEAVVGPEALAEMAWVAKSPLVVCLGEVPERVFKLIDERCEVIARSADGTHAGTGAEIFSMRGPARALLTGERVALNLAQRMCGVATLTREFVKAAAPHKAKIAATRKTTPLLRRLEKYAVTVGGGVPHRFGLDDGILIKDNHIEAAGGITQAVKLCREKVHHLLRIEVEAATLDQAEEAVRAGAEIVLLDNMDTETIRRAVELIGGRALSEASGNMTLSRIPEVAATGVDYISVGALTHSAPAADISAKLRAVKS